MILSIHLYQTYKQFLKDLIAERGRGSQTQLAAALRCTKSYLSQVLNDPTHLTQEQAFEVAKFAGLDSQATKFFLLLVQYERADHHELKTFLSQEIEAYRGKKQATLPFKHEQELRIKTAYRNEFYSAWRYMAINTALRVHHLSTAASIASYLGVPKKEVTRILGRLELMGLVTHQNGKYKNAEATQTVLDEDALLMENVLRACSNYLADALARAQKTGSNYAAFLALNSEDVKKASDILTQTTKKLHDLGISSKNPDHLYFIGFGFARASVEE